MRTLRKHDMVPLILLEHLNQIGIQPKQVYHNKSGKIGSPKVRKVRRHDMMLVLLDTSKLAFYGSKCDSFGHDRYIHVSIC